MQEFIKVPATSRSIAQRKPVLGVGINDAQYVISPRINKKQVMCPIYRAWSGMLQRCYSEKYQKRQPTYKGCTVCDEWLIFSGFIKWSEENNFYVGCQLDKDIKVKGNKIYSPNTCLFVSKSDNSIEANAKTYKFKSPNGESVEIFNLSHFCSGNGIDRSSMEKVYNGKYKQCKGWTKG